MIEGRVKGGTGRGCCIILNWWPMDHLRAFYEGGLLNEAKQANKQAQAHHPYLLVRQLFIDASF